MKQPEALRLANSLDREWANDALDYDTALNAAAELRRLHEANEKLVEALNLCLMNSTDSEFVFQTSKAAILKAHS